MGEEIEVASVCYLTQATQLASNVGLPWARRDAADFAKDSGLPATRPNRRSKLRTNSHHTSRLKNRLAQELAYSYWESGPCYHVLTHGPFSPIGVKDLTAILPSHFSILKCLMSQTKSTILRIQVNVRGVASGLIRHEIPCLLPCWCSANGWHERSRTILAPKGRSGI